MDDKNEQAAVLAVGRSAAAIRDQESRLKALIADLTDEALETARDLDNWALAGESPGPLYPLTVTIKDIIAQAGKPTTNGSNFPAVVAQSDAEVVRRLRGAGATIIGTANLHEFAYGGTTQNPFWGSCRNPWDLERIPGGSSGGSAASVAAGYCDLSLGTDTSGSGRLPTALTGICALRPTLGRISTAGVTPLSPFFDTISPMARTVRHVASLYSVIAGYDPKDPLSVERPVEPVGLEAPADLSGVTIGVAKGSFFDGQSDPGVAQAVAFAIEQLEKLGAELVEIEIPDIEEAPAKLEKLFHSDAAAVHADRLRQSPATFGPDIRERLETLGGRVTGAEYSEARLWAEAWRRRLKPVLGRVDAIVHPAAPAIAPRVADLTTTTTVTRRLARFCYPWSLAGTPVLTVPCGFAEESMPCGLALVGAWWNEARLFAIGMAFQGATQWHLKRAASRISMRNK